MALLAKDNSQYGDTKHKWRTPLVLFALSLLAVTAAQEFEPEPATFADEYEVTAQTAPKLTELPGGFVTEGQLVWRANKSPYLLREDLVVEEQGELVVEPGVEVRFGPMVGITVRGKIQAIVSMF